MVDEYQHPIISYVIYLVHSILEFIEIKTIFAILYLTYTFLFDSLQYQALIALFVLVLLDLATGISASKYNGEKIKSAKLRHTAIKITAYFTMIASAHLAEKGLLNVLSVLDETVLAFLLVTELISLLENMGRMGIDTPKRLIDKLVDYKNKQ